MENKQKLNVILGTGQLGQAIMRTLIKRGECIRMVNRSGKAPEGIPPHSVEITTADLYNPEEVRRVTQGAEVVFHTVNPSYEQWQEKFPALQKSLIEGMSGNTAPLVMGDNLYMYGPVSGPIREDMPYAAKTRKGSTRARIAEMLLEAHQQGKLRAVLGRGSDFFGPGVTSSMVGEPVFDALAKGKTANILGNPDLPHTYTFIDDFAQALIVLGEHEEALGQTWHVPNAGTITTRQFVTLAAQALDTQPKMMIAGPLMMRLLGLFIPAVREMIEMEYEVTQPFIVDDSKYKQAFGDHSTPLQDAIRQTADWYKGR
jgi:nucleoside-diphosphate-sugar epimerase